MSRGRTILLITEHEKPKVNFFCCTYSCSTAFLCSHLSNFAHDLTAVGIFFIGTVKMALA